MMFPLLIVVFLLFVGIGICCSHGIYYIRPSNFELVKATPAIVLAKALSYTKPQRKSRDDDSYGEFKFEVLKSLKGACTEQFIYEKGVESNESWGPEDDFSFQKGDTGPCNAVDY